MPTDVLAQKLAADMQLSELVVTTAERIVPNTGAKPPLADTGSPPAAYRAKPQSHL